jgi:hypothetical protein
MPGNISARYDRYDEVVIAAGEAESNVLDISRVASLTVHMPTAWTAASIGFKVSPTPSGTYLPLYDDDGNLLQIDGPVANRAYVAPTAAGKPRFVKLWSQNGAGVDTVQAAERTLVVDIKS